MCWKMLEDAAPVRMPALISSAHDSILSVFLSARGREIQQRSFSAACSLIRGLACGRATEILESAGMIIVLLFLSTFSYARECTHTITHTVCTTSIYLHTTARPKTKSRARGKRARSRNECIDIRHTAAGGMWEPPGGDMHYSTT